MPRTMSELVTPPPLSPLSLLGELTTMEGTALNLLGMAHSSVCISASSVLDLLSKQSTTARHRDSS